MKITMARLQTALAIAKGNGDSAAASSFSSAISNISDLVRVPYILPENLTPPAAAPDISTMSTQEVHDAVQAGVIPHEDAVAAGVNVAPLDQPVIESPAPAGEPGIQGNALPDGSPQPVTETASPPVVAEAAPVEPAVTPDPSVPTAEQAAPVDAAATSAGDPGDEDPTPADKETIASLDARLDKIERPGKVSRQ
jgi:hypothetical protein